MRVLIVSEGAHEQSALEAIVGRFVGVDLSIDSERVSRNDIHAHHGKGSGYFKRAVRWLLEAQHLGVDALVLVIDQDGDLDRNKQIEEAQQSEWGVERRALGVAIRTFDARMLADEKALSGVLNRAVNLQRNPESIKNPKKTAASLLAGSQVSLAQRDLYAQVVQKLDLQVLEKRCPRGFRPFAERLRGIVGARFRT
jgi:hypothetical protein